ncbi:MAG TPA: type VI secretion system tip protein TssI/VgrG [Terracidiphilus sp.]|nr:type VI secretion system tip protein TssI/VgrG [Terracidiphilus sp.]
MPSFAQKERLLEFTSPLGKDVLLAERFSGMEGVSELFRYEIELLAAADKTIDPKKIVGEKACLSIVVDGTKKRYFNGIVSSFEMTGGGEEFHSYRATVVPKMWLLALNTNTRVFQDKTVLDIIKAVLSPYGISPTENTSGTYAPLEYCTQYRETDLNFVSRLMEQYGIFYFFDHTADDHKLVLQDTSTKLSDCPIKNEFRYTSQGAHGENFYDFQIQEMSSRSTLVTGKHTAWDYSFVRYMAVPQGGGKAETKGPLGSNSHEDYDYADSAAAYLKKPASDKNIGDLATFYAQVRRDACDAGTSIVDGTSNAISMATGYTFTLQEHPHDKLNTKFLLLHVEHSAQQEPSYRSRQENPSPYQNAFTAMPFEIVYRPPIRTPKPVVNGMHTAKVVAESGEESHMDKYGRACVQFFWDRLRKDNTMDNTWVRVAQLWAGKGWGTYYWPREGDEVLVDFIEGDPDQPIVVGSLYNGVNMPKYDPTGQYTLSGILTRSSKDGGDANANELRFEDLKGKEQIYMNAEKDYDLHVENDWHTQVDKEQHTTIKTNRFDEVDGDAHFLTKGKHMEEVDGDAHLNIKGKNVVQIGGDREHQVTGNLKESFGQNSNISVGMNLNESVGQNYSLTVGMKQAIQAGMNFDVTAPMQISLNCGPNSIVLSPEGIGLNGTSGFISLGPAGVTISGVMVMINSGGAPVVGSPGSAQSPQSPSSPTAPTAPKWPGDAPPSQAKTAQDGSAGPVQALAAQSPSSSSPAAPPKPAAPPAVSQAASQAQQAVNQAANQAQQAANQAVNDVKQAANQVQQQAQQAASQAQQAAKQAEQQAQAAVNQAVNQARQTYNQAQQAVQQAQQQVSQAAAQGQAAAQQALNQAQQAANQAAQQAAQAVQQAQQQAEQVQQQAQAAANQAQQAANQAQQQAQQAVQQAQQQANQVASQAQQAANQAQQQANQAVGQAQQAASQAQQQAQQAANQAQQQVQNAAQQAQQQAQQAAQQAQQAAQQAQQQANQAAQQVNQAASQAQQQAQQAANQAQQSANQAISQATRGF